MDQPTNLIASSLKLSPHLNLIATIAKHKYAQILAVALLVLAVPSRSHAVTGFTGPFNLNDSETSTWTFTAPSPLVTNFTTDPGGCDPSPFLYSCLDWGSAASDGIVRINAGYDETGSTVFEWTNNSNISGYSVSFAITCQDCTNESFVDYSIGTVYGRLDFGNQEDDVLAYISSNTTIEFTITNVNAEGLNVQITGFNAVPTPLPATGAAAAFGFSRRLRRRIKGQRPDGTLPPPVIPAHPSAYLSLAPASVQSLPLSFHYANAGLPADAVGPQRVSAA